MKYVFGFIKTHWHSLVHCFKSGHNVCWYGNKYFCECGYNNGGVTWEQVLDKVFDSYYKSINGQLIEIKKEQE